MNAVLISDRKHVNLLFEASSKTVEDFEMDYISNDNDNLVKYINDNNVNTVFLDMFSVSFDAVLLLELLKIQCIKTVVICILDDVSLFETTLRYKADYFLLEPYTHSDIEDAIMRAKCLLKLHKKRVYFRTFGRFDMFIDDKLVHFRSSKAKELLALCVDHRGGVVTMEEAIDKLWGNRIYDSRVKNLYRHAIRHIRDILKTYNAEEIFKTGRGICNINYAAVDCDLFYYLENIARGNYAFKFTGSYMSEYPWAEDTVAMLERLDIGEKI